ncbi:DUF2577 domain-containing protein [Lederbergia wuyishanensis]|uniref:DUF2577 domain-containing protein n=1 Tax=Lederbergia wuyishanensis TaxID=1347903 RepID=A0ABU0D724_9BACI|nr:DUF2577 domain-containing protein [Lederbergia wuyishanensis]MCJ8008894.1 DUF2577 domain-containing protein [Lederbergia wuyishanensis]MDQ0344219.1 hypothetical protein [Lederbergia wuyishanensis]
MSMLDIVKATAVGAVNAQNPVNVLFGTVRKTGPIEIEVHQKLILTDEFLIMTESTKELKGGDRVVLLRVQGGHQFVVMDKVV